MEIGLKALAVDLEGARDYDWAKIAERLLPSAPRDVIGFAVERVRFDDEQLSELFANFAQQYPTEVLGVVSERLLNKKIVTLGATFEQTIQSVELVHFRAWLRGQSDEDMLEIADQLPRPFLDQEIAIVPDQTLAYFEELAGRNSISERAARHFLIHTFSTGVYMNHGIDLFSSRIELAKKLASHDDPFIRSWCGPFQKYAEDSLNRGRQRLEEDVARG